MAELPEAAAEDHARHEKAEREADPERLQLERADVESRAAPAPKASEHPAFARTILLVRRAVLAVFLCAAPLLAASAQASTDMLERSRPARSLRSQAHALRQRRGEAAASRGAARVRRGEPRRARAHRRARPARSACSWACARTRMCRVSRRSLRALGAEPERFETIAVLAVTVPSGAAAIAALRSDPRVAYVERDRTLRVAVDRFDSFDPDAELKYTWAHDAVRAGEAIAAVGGGSSRIVSVIDTGLDVNHPEFTGRIQQAFDTMAEDSNVTDIVGHGTFVTGLIAAIDGNGIGGKGVAGDHQGDRRARLARRRGKLLALGPDQRNRVLDPARCRRDQHEPRRRGLHPLARARPRGRLLQRRASGRRVGQQGAERQPGRVPRRRGRRRARAPAGSGCLWRRPSPTAGWPRSRTTTTT